MVLAPNPTAEYTLNYEDEHSCVVTSIPLAVHTASAMFLLPTATKALANFLYDALVSILSQAPNIFTLQRSLSRG